MSTFEAPNDYRNYLMHYGVKGMKWRNHRRSQMNKNFQLPTGNHPLGRSNREETEDSSRHQFSRSNTHRRTALAGENIHNMEPTRRTDGSRSAGQAMEDSRNMRRSRRRHDLSWVNTHESRPGNMQSIIGHIPRTAHTAENYTAATENLSKKRKKRR